MLQTPSHLQSKAAAMAEATEEKLYFKCPNCAVELLWNARVAGHRVSCPCGHVFVAPLRSAVISADAPEPEPERRPKRRDAEMAAMLMRPRKRVVDDEEEKGGVVRNVVVPSVLSVLGMAIALSQVTWSQPQIGDRSLHLSLLQVLVIMFAMVVTTVAAVVGLTFFMNVELGQLKPAAFKIISIPLFAGALGLAGGRLDKDPPYVTGMSIGWSLMIICYWIGFSYFFKLELLEVFLISSVVSIVQAVAIFGMFAAAMPRHASAMPPDSRQWAAQTTESRRPRIFDLRL
jgi:hypothetical protein